MTAIGDRLNVLTVCRDGIAYGMVVFIVQGQKGYLTYMGVDEKGTGAGFPYFNLAFYEPIRRSMELDVSSLLLGATAYAAKIKRGCQVRRTLLFVDPRWHPCLAWLVADLELWLRLIAVTGGGMAALWGVGAVRNADDLYLRDIMK